MSYHILLAFSNPEYRDYLISVLNGAGHQVDVVHSVDEAFSIEDGHSYEVAIIDADFDSPGQGWSLIKYMRNSPRWSTNLAIMTGLDVDASAKGDELFQEAGTEFRSLYDYPMILPRYLKTILRDIEAAIRAAQERSEKI